jgi:ribonucleoside-diphosphate reductase alpha chain
MDINNDVEKLLKDRYYLKNENSWEDVAKRVSCIYKNMYKDILEMNFLPSSPTLMNCNTGKERRGTLSSCFIMNIEDSISSIFDSLKECAIVTGKAGGVGYDFSILRGSNEGINSAGGKVSSGPIPFIEIFSSTLDGVQQGGVRRGAGMAMLSIEHPDILHFIRAKKIKKTLERFNFSIKINNNFYQTLYKYPDKIHQVKSIVTGEFYDLRDGDKLISTKQLWDEIIQSAHECAEPGIFNEDIAAERCAVTNLSNHVISNPCSEFTGIFYQSCNLGSINLSHLVMKNEEFDWNKFEDLICECVYYLNSVIDNNLFPLDKIKEITLNTKPIGLGIMGLAHLFIKLKIPYNSKKAIKLTKDIFKYMTLRAMKESVKIAKKKGKYKSFDYSTFMEANKRFFTEDTFRNINLKKLKKDIKKYGVYNSALTSIAPTGTISTLAQVSGGIEPLYALIYNRKVEKLNKEYDVITIFDFLFKDYLDKTFDEKNSKKISNLVIENNGSCQGIKEIPENIQKLFIVANDLTPKEHLDILEVCANNVSLSVSKTINLPSNATLQDVGDVYIDAHKRGIIGITIYRSGSREGILTTGDNGNGFIVEESAPKRPKSLPCHVYKIKVHGENWRVFIGLYKGHPYEVFAGKIDLVDLPSNIEEGHIVKVKSNIYQFEYEGEVLIADISKLFESGAQEALTRQISINLRHGTPVDFIIEQLQKSHGTIADFNKSILRALKRYMKQKVSKNQCPTCKSDLIFKEGCEYCVQCGFGKCG